MKKLTRKMFNRKIVSVGLAAFLGLGLVSTGFAAWVMSMGSEKKEDGDVVISTVTDVSIELDVKLRNDQDKDGDDTFVFDAKKDDRDGRVKWGQDKEQTSQTPGENLTITFDVTVSPVSSLDTLTVKIELPAGVQKAVDEGYLVAPACTSAVTLYEYKEENSNGNHQTAAATNWNYQEATDKATFNYSITFAWGEKFNGMNPCEYYDEDPAGMLVDDADVKTQMQAFETLLRGTPTNKAAIDAAIALNSDEDDTNDVEVPLPTYDYEYVVTFTATAK